MMAPGHAIGSAAFVLGLGLAEIHLGPSVGLSALPTGQVVAMAGAAVPFSFGRLSPDVDQRQPFRRWFGHRYAVHWWGWPVAVMAGLAVLGAPLIAFGPPLGWLSHIWPFDWLFGKGGQSVKRGIPRWPWRSSPRHGVGWRVSANQSWLERLAIGERRRHSVGEWIFTAILLAVVLAELYALGSLPV
jgi:hypothetical protein